jgi:hypothetical protein
MASGGPVNSLRIVFVAILCVSICETAFAAGANLERAYALPGHGTFTLRLPMGWDDQIRYRSGDIPPAIVLTGFEGSPFVVRVTPLWARSGADADFASAANIRALVEKAAHAAAPESVEDRLSIVTLGGGNGPGYYFTATDRDPKAGDFKYMTQGAVRVGELICTFTILTNDDKSTARIKALTMLSGAMQTRGK